MSESYTPDQLAAMDDAALLLAAQDAILAAAVMNGSRYADKYHDQVDIIYTECSTRRRGIYQRAFNAVARNQGHRGMVSKVREDSV